MKNILNLFFTMPAKILVSLIFLGLAVAIAECQTEYVSFYNEDNESFVNAMAQVDDFDYRSSRYYKNTVTKTVESIALICMNYSDAFAENTSVDKLVSYYSSIGDIGFLRASEQLSQMKGLQFALVNHESKKILSNIPEVNGLPSSADIRHFFGKADKNLLIARSCENPYFATDYFIDFTDEIRACAERYDDSFDLYVSFGDDATYAENEAACRELHLAMRDKIERLNDKCIIHIIILLLASAFLMTVTGKQEKGGKTYPTIMNRLPNDLLVLIYGIVLVCLSSLYRTSLDMLMTHGNELGAFWFARSEKFYSDRIEFCIVIFFCGALNLLCILKRQYRMGMLFKNTYLHSCIENLKKLKSGNSTHSKEEKQH